jgi:hypothetical protein
MDETRYDSMKKQLLLVGMMTILCVTTACGNGTDNEPTTVEDRTEQITEESSEDNTNMYAACTSLPQDEVEAFATIVKKQILDKDWVGLSENIAYPITVEGVTYNDSNAFSAGDFSTLYSDDFVKALENESCTGMFCNYQGIMLGNGQVWISEVLDADGNSEGLKVIALQAGE